MKHRIMFQSTPGTLDTLLLPTDNVLLILAPLEGRRLLVLTLDKHVEGLAYPCVFGGEIRGIFLMIHH